MATPHDRTPTTSRKEQHAIYLDHNATTPVDPDVFAYMRPFFCENFGNAASRTHAFGHAAHAAVEEARTRVAVLLGCDPRSIFWTSGATEANNLAIKGVAHALRVQGKHIITQATEHPSVLDCCNFLGEQGFEITVLPVDVNGLVSPSHLASAIRSDTTLVSIMLANNETGVVQPVSELAAICRRNGTLFHTDATQAAGKLKLNVKQLGIDFVSVSAHKMYGPKGVGALYVRSGSPKIRLTSQMHGGGHERGLRSGTLNVPGIVGFGAAAAKSAAVFSEEPDRILELRKLLENALLRLGGLRINGFAAPRLPNTTSVSFEGLDAEAALVAMAGLALSTGSACTSISVEPSHVLEAMGLIDAQIRGTIRFSLGRTTSKSDIELAMKIIEHTVVGLRALRHA